MFFNSLKFALRSLGKYKMYTLVNLIGLTLGITAALLIALYVVDELSFDDYHPDAERIYQLVAAREIPGQGIQRTTSLPAPLGPGLVSGFTEIEANFRLTQLGRADLTYENNAYYEGVLAVDSAIFEFFEFSFISGDAESALADPGNVVLTRSAATKYFGDENPIGKVLTGTRGPARVTAVIEDPPINSHMRFNVLFPFPPYLQNFMPQWPTNWNIPSFTHYLKLAAGTDVVQLEQRLTEFLQQTPFPNAENYTLSLLTLGDIHFGSADIQQQWHSNPGNVYTVYTLQAIALFLLMIACINYTSLATARSVNRTHEISLRKMVGAGPNQLMVQFLAEAILLVLFAVLLAVSVSQMLLPVVNAIVGKSLTLATFAQPQLCPALVLAVLGFGIAAGAWPAFVLSRQPVSEGLTNTHKAAVSSGLLRKVLVLTQFTLSVVLVFSTLVVMRQMAFIQDKPLGFDQTNVVAIDINSGNVRQNIDVIRNEFLEHSNVSAVSNSARLPGDWKPIQSLLANLPGRAAEASQPAKVINIDEHFLETFSITLLEGRNLDASSPQESVIVNRAFVEAMGLDNPLTALITISGTQSDSAAPIQGNIIGVVEDFHYESLHQEIQPLVMANNVSVLLPFDYFSVRVSNGNLDETIQYLREVMQRHDPVVPFEYNFIDAQMTNFYSNDRLTASLFAVAAGMAIFIACMGLFGLSSFSTEQRSKEVGIRKVLGATVAGIVRLLSADFMKPVLLAIVIALPLGYYLMNQWLQNFAYYVNIGVDLFLLAALLAIGVSLATVSIQSVRAALRNPVESISYE